MKKRIALAAAIAMAISVGGMLPASAAKLGAPVVADSACARAGGTLEVKQADGNLYVSVTASAVVIDTADGTDPADCSGASLSLSGLTSVILKATDASSLDGNDNGNIWFDLEGATAGTVANYGSIPMTVQAEAGLWFDGSGLTESTLRPFVGTISEESFTVGSLTGPYYAGVMAFLGGSGADVFDASAVTTTSLIADGNLGGDTIKGGAGDDDLTGDAGADKLYGNAGSDILNGYGDGSAEIERGRSGKYKTVTIPSGSDELWGGDGDDLLKGDVADTVAPGDGADEIKGTGNGTNVTGISTLLYADSGAAVTVNLATAAGVVKSTAGDDYYTGSVGAFVGSAFGDTFVGDDTANAFYGEAGADVIKGFGAADEIGGGGGTDTIKAGAGDDVVYGDSGADLINGGAGNDTIYGDVGDDIMYGSAGDDILRGLKGSDQAWGGKGTFDVCAAEVTDSCEFKK